MVALPPLPIISADNPKNMPRDITIAVAKEIFQELHMVAAPIAQKRQKWIKLHRGHDKEFRAKIFQFWAQGITSAPAIVKTCYREMRRHHNDDDLCFLDNDSWKFYVDIPDHVIDNLGTNFTAFSDLLRVELLSKFGGVWADATCYCTQNLINEFHEMVSPSGFFAFDKGTSNRGLISNWFMASEAGSYPMCLMRELLLLYWENYSRPVHYFFFHQFFNLSYQADKKFRMSVHKAPLLDWKPRELKALMLKKFERESFNRALCSSPVHKLTYKIPISKFNSKTTIAAIVRGDALR